MAKRKGSKAAKAKLGKIIAAPTAAPTVAPKIPVKPMVGFKDGGVIKPEPSKATVKEAVTEAVKSKATQVMGHDKRKAQMDALGLKHGGVVNRHGTERNEAPAAEAAEHAPAAKPAASFTPPPTPAAETPALRAPMVKRKDDAMLAAPRRNA